MANQFGRRRFIILGGAGIAGTMLLKACTKPGASPSTSPDAATSPSAPVAANGTRSKWGFCTPSVVRWRSVKRALLMPNN